MNRAYLRPPVALFQLTAALLSPLVIWGVLGVWSHRLPDLQRIYLADYSKASVLPDMAGLKSVLDFGPGRKTAKPQIQVAICYRKLGQDVLAEGRSLDWSLHPHPVVIQMRPKAWAGWLERNVFGQPPIALLFAPAMAGVLLSAILFGLAWRLDQERHLKFRSQGRQLRGPEMVTRAQFRRRVKGRGLGWRTEARRSVGEFLQSVRVAGSEACAARPEPLSGSC